MAKMMSPNTTLWWVPESAITNPDVDLFKASLYQTSGAAIDLSCAVVAGYTLNPTDADTDDTRSICDVGNVANPTIQNYEALLTFFREEIKSGQAAPGTDSVYDKAFNLFKRGLQDGQIIGYWVQRIGFRQGTAAAEGQLVSAYKFVADNPRDEVGDGAQPIQFTVPFLAQGWLGINKPLTA